MFGNCTKHRNCTDYRDLLEGGLSREKDQKRKLEGTVKDGIEDGECRRNEVESDFRKK